MRIKRIAVQKYKNLVDFECDFSGSNISAFIGDNGSGKSNLIELITHAFSLVKNYSSGKSLSPIMPGTHPSVIGCTIDYLLDGVLYTLRYNTNVEEIHQNATNTLPDGIREQIEIWNGESQIPKGKFAEVLPESILLYYAGETQRQKGIAELTNDNLYESRLKKAKTADLPGLRFMDLYNIEDLTLLLAVASAYRGTYYQQLIKLLGYSDISPRFSLILKQPEKGKGSGDTYWGSTGFVKFFLNDLRKSVARTRDQGKQYYMFFDSADALKTVSVDEFDLFAKLKVLKKYGILDHIGIQFEKENGDKFSSLRLSEGEKQLALVFLLIAFTANNNVLYLFDEFDAYLHLNWQRAVSEMINRVNVKGHIIFTTHSPATISKIQSKNVYRMKEGKPIPIFSDTFNRSLDEIMEEHMDVTLRPHEYTELVQEFRNAVMHSHKDIAIAKLEQIKEVVGERDPFFITARIALNRMG